MARKVPSYSFSGQSTSEMVGDYWVIYLLSSGMFRMHHSKKSVGVFLCGGGGGGGSSWNENGGGGGAGGHIATTQIALGTSETYVTIGNGGYAGEAGADTSGFEISAKGGAGTVDWFAGTDGTASGGAGGVTNGATGGGSGSNGQQAFGFGDIFYGAGGGGGAAENSSSNGAGGKTGGGEGGSGNGQANTGAGGGGAKSAGGAHVIGGYGGSGIAILVGTEDDFLPVYFNGKQLSEIFYNGSAVTGLICGGARIFARRCRKWLLKRWACRFASLRATPAL